MARQKPEADEVIDWKWTPVEEIEKQLVINRQDFTYWFSIAFRKMFQQVEMQMTM